MSNIVEEMLYSKPIPSNEKCLPSPKDLKGYILVKVCTPGALGENKFVELWRNGCTEHCKVQNF